VIFISLKADFLDDDMDGVENSVDRCPNSSIVDIVDKYGCAIQKLNFKTIPSYDISIGYYKSSDDTMEDVASLSFGYWYGDFSGYFYTSSYLSDENINSNNSMISLYYKFASSSWIGFGVYLSNEDSDKNDYFVKLKKKFVYKNIDFSVSIKHIFMNDEDTKDTDNFTTFLGFDLTSNLYTSLSYSISSSAYDEKNLQTFSLSVNYDLSQHTYISIDLIKGLTQNSADIYGFSLGYSF